jgi:hypothetical protein
MIRSYCLRKNRNPPSSSYEVTQGSENKLIPFIEDIQDENEDSDEGDTEYSRKQEVRRRRKVTRKIVCRKERKNNFKSSSRKCSRTSENASLAYPGRVESRVKNISKRIREGNDCTILGIMARRFSKLLQVGC